MIRLQLRQSETGHPSHIIAAHSITSYYVISPAVRAQSAQLFCLERRTTRQTETVCQVVLIIRRMVCGFMLCYFWPLSVSRYLERSASGTYKAVIACSAVKLIVSIKVLMESSIWALYIRKTSKRNCFRLGGQPAAPVTIGELSSIYSAIRRNSSAYLNFTLILPPS